MKKKISLIGLLLVALIISACGIKNSNNGANAPSFDDVYSSVVNAMKDVLKEESGLSDDEVLTNYFIENLTEGNGEDSMTNVVFDRMDLNPELLANGRVIGAMMNVNADEVFILEAKTTADVAAIKESLERERAAQVQVWEQYLPEQYEKVKNNVIETKGNYLLYVTFSDPDKVVKAFKAQY